MPALASLGTALFLATRWRMPRRWRGVLLSLVGACTCSLNWSTGQAAFKILRVQLFGSGFVKVGAAAPWVISFAIPVGALLAFSHYRQWRHVLATSSAPDVAPLDPSPVPEIS